MTKITISLEGKDIDIKVFNPNSEEDGLARLLADIDNAEVE